jgi:hypothetical protein
MVLAYLPGPLSGTAKTSSNAVPRDLAANTTNNAPKIRCEAAVPLERAPLNCCADASSLHQRQLANSRVGLPSADAVASCELDQPHTHNALIFSALGARWARWCRRCRWRTRRA